MGNTAVIHGFEYDWLASDTTEHVAFLSTAGGGHVPELCLRDLDLHEEAITQLLALPTTTTALFFPKLPAHVSNTWKQVAERGVFAFDSDAFGGPYRLVAAPYLPILTDALPPLASALARKQRLHVQFAGTAIIPADLLVETLQSGV